MKINITLKSALAVLFLVCLMTGCSTPKNITYFQGVKDAEILEIASTANREIKVEPFDKLSIMVSCKDAALAQMFNLNVFTNSQVSRASASASNDYRNFDVGYSEGINGFTVSAEGTIDYPILGKLKVEGMTRSELAAFIKGEIMGKGLIKDPVVTVEFLSVGISVLGEVHRPGRYDLNKDVLSIVEAISYAGDLTINGKRENIMVIRNENDGVKTYLLDITDPKSLAQSPAYYLKQGDVVYVEPSDMRKRQSTNNGNNVMNISFWLSVVSLLTTAAVLLK